MKKLSILAIGVLILSGCATTKGYEQMLQTWVGSSESNLVAAWGIPDGVYQMNAYEKVITYQRGGTTYLPGSAPSYQTTYYGNTATTRPVGGSPGYVISQSCKTDFVVTNGIVSSWRWEGNSCRAIPPKAPGPISFPTYVQPTSTQAAPQASIVPIPKKECIPVGESKAKVIAVMGMPNRIENIQGEDWLWYGKSCVQLDANNNVKHAFDSGDLKCY